ncbi:15365_t:CDS:2 [Funneliformis mosseae]|uniref:15365_t:CDS:1 n=1 Tax=Funneliformis mosseae TaxID=27381 RepID=A0A9N9GIT7_FUNMO|nr:15365_t:CDS:2 [Funneliformis mosseae]
MGLGAAGVVAGSIASGSQGGLIVFFTVTPLVISFMRRRLTTKELTQDSNNFFLTFSGR